MIENFNSMLANVAQSNFGKTARRSVETIWSAHLDAFETTRHEANRVFELALKEGQKISRRTRSNADGVVEDLAEAADDKLSTWEKAMQKNMDKVIHQIGLPTAKDVNALTRRVDVLATKVKSRGGAKKTTARRKPAAKRKARSRRAA